MFLFLDYYSSLHGFKTRTGPAGRTGPTMNRRVRRFGPLIGSVMLLNRREPVKFGLNRWLGGLLKTDRVNNFSVFFWTRNKGLIHIFFMLSNRREPVKFGLNRWLGGLLKTGRINNFSVFFLDKKQGRDTYFF